MSLPPGYRLSLSSSLERSLLVKFMQRTYKELDPTGSYSHLAQTVDHYLGPETPLWWVEPVQEDSSPSSLPSARVRHPIACLWLGNAIDQLRGDRYAHIFLLYVAPEHRRQGIATALMQEAETWAKQRGDRQIGLQVFQSNQAALNLYSSLEFQTQSLWMVKPLTRS